MRPSVFPALLAVALAAAAAPALSQTLPVAIDHSQRLSIGGSVLSVVVGNPAVADVTVVDSHTLYIVGKAYGQTDVVALDAYGRTLYQAEVVVGSPGAGRVTVYRGGARTDMACAPNCQAVVRTGGGGPSSGGGPSGGGAPNLPGMVGAMAAGAASAGAAGAASLTPGG